MGWTNDYGPFPFPRLPPADYMTGATTYEVDGLVLLATLGGENSMNQKINVLKPGPTDGDGIDKICNGLFSKHTALAIQDLWG